MFKFSARSKSRMVGVHRELAFVFEESLKDSPIDFGIPEYGGLRLDEEQNKLYLDKKSKCDGYFLLSNHQKGEALDFYAFVDGAASWDVAHLSMVAGVIMATATRLKREGKISITLRWGGTFGEKGNQFKGWDMPHMEIFK